MENKNLVMLYALLTQFAEYQREQWGEESRWCATRTRRGVVRILGREPLAVEVADALDALATLDAMNVTDDGPCPRCGENPCDGWPQCPSAATCNAPRDPMPEPTADEDSGI